MRELEKLEKSEKIYVLTSIIIVGFFVGVIFHYFFGFYFGFGYPRNTFLNNPSVQFTDFTDIIPAIKDFAPYSKVNYWINYFPLAYIFLFPFCFIKNLIMSYLVFVSIFFAFWIPVNIKMFKCESLSKIQNFQNIFILTFLTYPFLVILDRGNFDMMLLILLTAFVFLFKEEKYLISAVVLAIINAIKPFSVIFLILFIFEKKWKELFSSIIISILLIIAGFLVLHGSFLSQIFVYLNNLEITKNFFIYYLGGGVENSSSLFMALKAICCKQFAIFSTYKLAKICGIINLFLTSITIFFTWKENTFWKKIALLTCFMIVSNYLAFDYKLIFLFIPIWLFINEKEKSNFDLLYTILFGLLLIPKRFFLNLIGSKGLLLFSVVVNPFILLGIMGLIIYEQFYLKKKNAKSS